LNYNQNKYLLEGSDLLTEAEKIRMAADLRELVRQGVLEYHDGRWKLADGVEVEETPAGPLVRVGKQDNALPSQFAESSTPSSGEPSETRVPPLAEAAQPSSEGSGSPDSDDEVSEQ